MLILKVASKEREEVIDITRLIAESVSREGYKNGAVHLYCQHTTCGLTINEGADPDVRVDLMKFFKSVAPQNNNWRHYEGNSDAHIRSSLLGVSLLIPIIDGRLCLGQWQSIYLYEGDGPRMRSILMQHLSGN